MRDGYRVRLPSCSAEIAGRCLGLDALLYHLPVLPPPRDGFCILCIPHWRSESFLHQ